MAVLPRRYLNCVFYIYPDRASAESGKTAGGTGFLAARWTGIGADEQVFLLTNRHVVEGFSEPHIRLNKVGGGTDVTRVPKDWWRNHPDGADISAAQVNLSEGKYQIAWVRQQAFLTPRRVAEENIGLGDHVVMLGRFATHDGKEENMPSARFGHIAMLPSDPVTNKFGHPQETILAEYFSIPGFSGSPVFVYILNNARSEQALENPGYGPWLLGMNWMHFKTPSSVRNSAGADGAYVNSHTGMSGVIPAWRIASLIESFPLPEVSSADKET